MRRKNNRFIYRVKELWQKEKYYWCGAVVIGVLFTIFFSVHMTKDYATNIQNGIEAKVVRFHVLANSDGAEDQELKLKVRDKILEHYGELLSDCENKEETLEALENVKEDICEVAQDEVFANGYEYPVTVSIVREEFPKKVYEDFTFPAGVYDALRVEIGESAGENWWCVLYPQMCYVDATWGYATDESVVKLENSLTEEEFLVVSAMGQDDNLPKLKLKIVDWWQSK